MITSELFHVAVVPCVVAVCVAIVCRRLRCAAEIGWAAGVGLGFVAGQFALECRSGVVVAMASFVAPREAVQWLPIAVLMAIGITLLAVYTPSAWRRLVVALAVTLCTGLPLRLLAGSAAVTERWSTLEKLCYFALLSATFGLTWLVLASPRDTEHPRLRPLLLLVVAAGSAVVVTFSGVFVYGELCGVVAAAIGGVLLVASFPLRRTPLSGVSGLAGVLTCSLTSLILLSCFFAKLSPLNAALVLCSLMIAGGRMPEVVLSLSAWQQAVLRVGLSLTPLAIAFARAIAAAQANVPAGPYTA